MGCGTCTKLRRPDEPCACCNCRDEGARPLREPAWLRIPEELPERPDNPNIPCLTDEILAYMAEPLED